MKLVPQTVQNAETNRTGSKRANRAPLPLPLPRKGWAAPPHRQSGGATLPCAVRAARPRNRIRRSCRSRRVVRCQPRLNSQPDPVHEVALPWTLSGFRHSFIFYVGLNSPSMAALNGEKWDFTTVPTSCVERLLPSQADRARRLLVVVEPLNLSGSHPSAIQVGALRRFRRRTSSIQPPTPSCVM
jgi:hypothetical protein